MRETKRDRHPPGVQIKICGLTSVREAAYLNRNQVDYAGMVLFFEKSRRCIGLEQAQRIMEALNPEIRRVAVVVSPDVKQAAQIEKAGFDCIQIHGTLWPAVSEALSIPVIRAVHMPEGPLSDTVMDDFETGLCSDNVSGILFDAGAPGSGRCFDWQRMRYFKERTAQHRKKLFLAGGLTPENIQEAVVQVEPDVVDVSSGVEYIGAPEQETQGILQRMGKDPARIAAFVRGARRWQNDGKTEK